MLATSDPVKEYNFAGRPALSPSLPETTPQRNHDQYVNHDYPLLFKDLQTQKTQHALSNHSPIHPRPGQRDYQPSPPLGQRRIGLVGYYLQSLIEEDLLGEPNFRKELEDEIAFKVTREGERTLVNNLREVKHTITEALAAKVKDKIDEDLAAPLRAWASK